MALCLILRMTLIYKYINLFPSIILRYVPLISHRHSYDNFITIGTYPTTTQFIIKSTTNIHFLARHCPHNNYNRNISHPHNNYNRNISHPHIQYFYDHFYPQQNQQNQQNAASIYASNAQGVVNASQTYSGLNAGRIYACNVPIQSQPHNPSSNVTVPVQSHFHTITVLCTTQFIIKSTTNIHFLARHCTGTITFPCTTQFIIKCTTNIHFLARHCTGTITFPCTTQFI
eukprot:57442_1